MGNDAQLYYITLGAVRHIVPRWITLGLSSMVPTAMFQSQEPHFADHRDQYFSNSLDFELLGDRTKNAQFVMALGSQPLSWLSLGMGVTLSTHARTRTSVFVSEATGKAPPLVAPNISIQSAFVPHASFTLLPLDGLLVTGAFHWKYSNPVHTDHRQTMWYSGGKDDAATSYTYTFDYGFQPIRGSLGVSYQVPDRSGVSLTLATGVRYSLWSQYRDRMGQAPTLPWKNTLSPSLGLAGVFAKVHQVHLDSLYVPSPVPQQTGRSNYVDNHRLALAAAYRFTFPMGSRTGSVSAHVQVHRLIRRSHTKDMSSADPVIDEFPEARDARTGEIIPDSLGFQTNNPGYPGFSSEGTIISTGLSFGMGF